MDPFVKDSALPFLAPQPSGSDASRIREFVANWYSDGGMRARLEMDILAFAAAVRAEATLAADATFEDEQAAHQDTLRLLAAKDAQIAALREALESIEPYQDAGGHWCIRCGASFWTMPDQTEAERVASVRRAALEMSGGVL